MFRKGDPIADRKRGAQIIGALVRGYLARQRLQKVSYIVVTVVVYVLYFCFVFCFVLFCLSCV